MLNRQVGVLLRQAIGQDLPAAAIAQAVRQRMKHNGITDHNAYAAQLFGSREEVEALVDLVVVPETWFFRDADAFAAACRFIQQTAARVKRPVRALSIPCASGEEPYSLAMALMDHGVPAELFTITGIDVSRRAIANAERALYSRNAFRSSELTFRDRYFTEYEGGYLLCDEIRRMVRFRIGNLLAADLGDDERFDLIFCRNLLIYFDEQTQRAAAEKLHTLLDEDGLLFAGYAEAASFCRYGFAMAAEPKTFGLKKKVTTLVPEAASAHKPLETPRLRPAQLSRRSKPDLPQSASPPAPTGQAERKPASPTPEVLLAQARQLADQGRLDDALDCYHGYLQMAPDSADAYFMLGLIHEHKKKVSEAEKCLRRAVYLDPHHYDALCHLALLAEGNGNADAAAGFRQRAARVFRRQSERQVKK